MRDRAHRLWQVAVQHWALLRGQQVNELVVCTAVMLALYVGSALYFCCKENVAVRTGWGRVLDSGGGMDSDDELEMDLKLDDARDSVFAIDEFLGDAIQRISESDEVLEHRPAPATAGTPPPGPEPLAPAAKT